MFDAISSTKGCYTGQEVVERVISLGKLPAKVTTYGFESDGTEAIEGSEIIDTEKSKAGEIISLVSLPSQSKKLLLARVKRAFLEKDLFLTSNDNTIALKTF